MSSAPLPRPALSESDPDEATAAAARRAFLLAQASTATFLRRIGPLRDLAILQDPTHLWGGGDELARRLCAAAKVGPRATTSDAAWVSALPRLDGDRAAVAAIRALAALEHATETAAQWTDVHLDYLEWLQDNGYQPRPSERRRCATAVAALEYAAGAQTRT